MSFKLNVSSFVKNIFQFWVWVCALVFAGANQALAAPPVIVLSPGAVTFTEPEGSATVTIVVDAGLTVSDPDSTTLASAEVSISQNYSYLRDAMTAYAPALDGLVTATFDSETGKLLIVPKNPAVLPTVAQWQEILRTLVFSNVNDTPSVLPRTLTYRISDGTETSAPVTKIINVVATNDPPVNTVPGAQSVWMGTPLVFNAANSRLISVADPDAGSSLLKVSLSVSQGTLSLSGIAGLTFVVGDGTADPSMEFTGTLTAINAALNGLIFTPTSLGAATLAIVTNDQDVAGGGGAKTDTDTIALNVYAPQASVSHVSASSADGVYKIGDPLSLTVVFDQPVTVVASGGVPSLALETGETDRTATYTSGSGSTTLVFSYTVQAGDVSADLDYTGPAALVLNGGTINGGMGPSLLTLPPAGGADSLGGRKALVIDGVRPTVATFAVAAAGPLGPTHSAPVTLRFSEAVAALTNATLTVQNGTLSPLASTDGGVTWTATLMPAANVTAASNVITLDLTQVTDLAGNAGTGTATSDVYAVDTQAPAAPSVPASAENPTASLRPTLTGTAEAGALVTLYNGANVAGTATATGGNWSIAPATDLVAGVHSFTATATDAAGNVSAPSGALSLYVGVTFSTPRPDGFAASVTGGGAQGAQSVTVFDAASFRTHAESDSAAVITVVGILNLGTPVNVKSNKTIQGIDAGATLVGNLRLGSAVTNVIIRGLNITHPGTTIASDAYTDGGDGITLDGARDVFITQCSFFNCADHALRIINGADRITVSWSEFDYTAAQTVHRYSVLIGSEPANATIPRVTLHHNRWSTGVTHRMPYIANAQVHAFGNLLDATGNTDGTDARDGAQLLSERNVYAGINNPLVRTGTGRVRTIDNAYNATTGTAAYAGTDAVFVPAYSYVLPASANVTTDVTSGAGNLAGGTTAAPAARSASITGTATVTRGSAFTLTASVTGATATSYQWRRNHTVIAGATTAALTVASAADSDAADYTAVAVLASGEGVVSTPFKVTVNQPPAPPPAPPASGGGGGGGGGSPSLGYLGALLVLAALRALRRRS